MKLANLFLITALVSVVAAIGCTDPAQQNGNGGTGGDGNGGTGGTPDACATGDCADSSADVQAACGTVKTFCNSDDCCTLPGTGGAGGSMMIDPSPAACDAAGQAVCELAGAGGAGGDGGTGGGGGDGGTGGGGLECDYTAGELCALCDNADAAPDCEETFNACVANPPSGPIEEACDKCAVIARSDCGL